MRESSGEKPKGTEKSNGQNSCMISCWDAFWHSSSESVHVGTRKMVNYA